MANEEPIEEWRPVVGWEGLYEVSSMGRVRTLHRRFAAPRIRRHCITRQGYHQVYLVDGTRRKPLCVHRVVAAAFIGPCPDGVCVNHKNGLKDDNRFDNLEYVTPGDNNRHAFRTGLKPRPFGEMNHQAKLSDLQVSEIRNLYRAGGVFQRELAERFKISQAHVSSIVRGARRGVPTDSARTTMGLP